MDRLPDFLTVEEVATLTRRKPAAIYTERHRGEGIGTLGVKIGQRILFRRSDLDAFFDQARAEQLQRSA
jgi:hypothetical protein